MGPPSATGCGSRRNTADVVVVGAGAGGLAAAVRLSAAGRRVIVCEQDRHVGGTAHVFTRRGFVFPAGPLSFAAPDFLACTLRELGVPGPPASERDIFQVRRRGLDVVISVPLPRVAEQLVRIFPRERAGVEAVVTVLEEIIAAFRVLPAAALTIRSAGAAAPTGHGAGAAVTESSPTAGRRAQAAAFELLARWGAVDASGWLSRHIGEPRVRDLLGSQGTSEPTMPVVLLARMWDFMAEQGIWYPVGGVGSVGELLATRLREVGGDLRLGAQVRSLVVRGGRVAGVSLHDGEEIAADVVISDADYGRTLRELVPEGALDAATREDAAGLPLTPSAFTVFLGVRADRVDLSAFRGHQLLVKLEEGPEIPWELKRPVADDLMTDELWLSWWSRHDRRLAPRGHEALMIKVMAPFAPFAPLDGGGRRRHPEAYHRMKERMGDALVSAAERVLPGLEAGVVQREIATPLTYRDWGHRTQGSVAGWSWRAGDVPEPWAQELVVTPLPGLLAVGLQSYTRLFLGGMGTALYSGVRAADLALEGLEGR